MPKRPGCRPATVPGHTICPRPGEHAEWRVRALGHTPDTSDVCPTMPKPPGRRPTAVLRPHSCTCSQHALRRVQPPGHVIWTPNQGPPPGNTSPVVFPAPRCVTAPVTHRRAQRTPRTRQMACPCPQACPRTCLTSSGPPNMGCHLGTRPLMRSQPYGTSP